MRACSSLRPVLIPGALLLLGACAAAHTVPHAAPPPVSTEGYLDAGAGVRLYYRLVGSGPDTIVVLHGGPGFSLEYLAPDLAPLAATHTLLFYDQRGSGWSTLVADSAGLDAKRYAEDLEAVRRHFGFEQLTLLGHSWGAAIAALYAADHPERIGRLIIVGGVPVQRAGLVRTFRDMAAGRDSATRVRMSELAEAMRQDPGNAEVCRAYYVLWYTPFFADPRALGRSKGDFCAGSVEARRNDIQNVDRFVLASLGEWDWRPALRRVQARALILHGSVDVIAVEEGREWASALPNGRLSVLEGVGHFPYLEVPERFFAEVNDFLKR
jgi:proline iminopeptidase